MTGDAAKPMVDFIVSANAVIMQLIKIIMMKIITMKMKTFQQARLEDLQALLENQLLI